jgi:hypothetical protein
MICSGTRIKTRRGTMTDMDAGARRTRYADNLCALPPCAKGDTLQGAKHLPRERHGIG